MRDAMLSTSRLMSPPPAAAVLRTAREWPRLGDLSGPGVDGYGSGWAGPAPAMMGQSVSPSCTHVLDDSIRGDS